MDEVFNLIRIGIDQLPEGKIKVTPTLLFSRLKHQKLKPYSAIATLKDESYALFDEGLLMSYKIEVPELKLTFEVVFKNKGTNEILAFKEIYPSAFDGQLRETVATRKSIQWLDYWTKNSKTDYKLREGLKLDYQ